MWLLDTSRAELAFFVSPESVPDPGFAILSHTWGKNEQSFQDIQKLREKCQVSGENPRDLVCSKIRECCKLAERHGFKWVWIDTCCIDKTSSAELSEAINSMFRYYSLSTVCYAYIEDCRGGWYTNEPTELPGYSRWYRRGWTLQELIAPPFVLFLTERWGILGSKADLASELEKATGVPASLLRLDTRVSDYSVAQRMSWMKERSTTRPEDEAYCLLGIFGVNMPTLYGEGKMAFRRLQEEIIRHSPDTTILAWGFETSMSQLQFEASAKSTLNKMSLLSSAPGDFFEGHYSKLRMTTSLNENPLVSSSVDSRHNLTLTPHGLQASKVPIAVVQESNWYGYDLGYTLTLANFSWSLSDPKDERTTPVFLLLISKCASPIPSNPTYYVMKKGARRLVVDGVDTEKLTWTTEDILIGNPDLPVTVPNRTSDLLFHPSNRSLSTHFQIRQPASLGGYFRLEATDLSGDLWKKGGPTTFSLVEDCVRSSVKLQLGLCSAGCSHAATGSSSEQTESPIHWAHVVSDEDADSIPHQSDHACPEDHIDQWPNHRRTFTIKVVDAGVTHACYDSTLVNSEVSIGFVRSLINSNTLVLNRLIFVVNGFPLGKELTE